MFSHQTHNLYALLRPNTRTHISNTVMLYTYICYTHIEHIYTLHVIHTYVVNYTHTTNINNNKIMKNFARSLQWIYFTADDFLGYDIGCYLPFFSML